MRESRTNEKGCGNTEDRFHVAAAARDAVPPRACRCQTDTPQSSSVLLRQLDVFGTRAFLSISFSECDFLSFPELIVGYANETGRVKEQVLASPNINESESFIRESFDRTFSHFFNSPVVYCDKWVNGQAVPTRSIC